MKFKALVLASIFTIVSLPIFAAEPTRQSITTGNEVSTAGGAESVTITNDGGAVGYLTVKTENEEATASLVVTVFNSTPLGDFLVCTMTAITTDTTTVALLGSTVTAADGITDACDFPLTESVKFTFTVTGAGADFDVSADMDWTGQ